MPDAPPALRGQFYNTHLYYRCPEYQLCRRCHMCSSYNQHNPVCVYCESGKPGGRHHQCTSQQIQGIIRIEELMGRHILDPSIEGQNVDTKVCMTAQGENMQLADEIQAEEWTHRKGR